MNLPAAAAIAATGFVLFEMMRGNTASSLAKSTLKNHPLGTPGCNQKYCPPTFQIQVDRAINTDLRDDTLGGGSLKGAYDYVQKQYLREARESPGVNLVAHTVM